MLPRFIAATAPAEAPTPIAEKSSGFSPAFTARFCTDMCVLDPGAVTPTLRPFRSAADLYCAAFALLMPSTMPL